MSSTSPLGDRGHRPRQALRRQDRPGRRRPRRPPRLRVRAARPQRRRQDDRGARPDHADRARRGPARVAGHDVVADPVAVRRSIGLAAQDATVDGLLTGRENLVMIGELHHLGRKRAKARADELLEQFSLDRRRRQLAKEYSGGMRRRLDLAATLVAASRGPVPRRADDRPGPPRAQRAVGRPRPTWWPSGATILLTTQYLEEADRLADDIVVVDHGRVIARGDARVAQARRSAATSCTSSAPTRRPRRRSADRRARRRRRPSSTTAPHHRAHRRRRRGDRRASRASSPSRASPSRTSGCASPRSTTCS